MQPVWVYLCKLIGEKVEVVVSLCLCLKHKELNEKVKQDLVQVSAECVEQDLVQFRTTYDSISWFQIW